MSTQPAVRRWTYDEFARLPNDGNRYEVIGGELYVTPAPTLTHQKVVTRLVAALVPFVQANGLGELYVGPVDVLFAEGDYLEPDLVFVRANRTAILRDRGVEGAPDLVVEVLSPSTAGRDRTLKRERYAAFGVAEYWVVDASRKQVEIYRVTDDASRQMEVATDSFEWQPDPDGPSLMVKVSDLLGG